MQILFQNQPTPETTEKNQTRLIELVNGKTKYVNWHIIGKFIVVLLLLLIIIILIPLVVEHVPFPSTFESVAWEKRTSLQLFMHPV